MFKYWDYTSGEIPKAIKEMKNVILPLGAVEAHSDHLPLGTDNYLVEAYSNELAEMTNSLIMPLIPFGQVWSLQYAPGSIHIEEEVLVNYLVEIIKSLSFQGVQMVTLVSAHFGNINAMKIAARKVYEKFSIKVIYFTYPGINEAKPVFENLNNHSSFLHADEVETSLMLHYKPNVVYMDKINSGLMDVPKELDYTPVRWTEFTNTYIIGDARQATAEKGKEAMRIILENASKIVLQEKEQLEV